MYSPNKSLQDTVVDVLLSWEEAGRQGYRVCVARAGARLVLAPSLAGNTCAHSSKLNTLFSTSVRLQKEADHSDP